MPGKSIDLWMLMNRTCHLVESQGRSLKTDYLTFCPVIKLSEFLIYEKPAGAQQIPSIKTQIKNIVKGQDESIGYLPLSAEHGMNEECVVNFNMVWSQNVVDCPGAESKNTQLSSPYCEHLMQKFARWFSAIGFDDEALKTNEAIEGLTEKYQKE